MLVSQCFACVAEPEDAWGRCRGGLSRLGAPGTLRKDNQTELEFTFDGIVGDRHRGPTREAWALTDKQPEGTERRNERQWSAVARKILMWFPTN